MIELQPNIVADNVVVSLGYTLTVDGEVIDSTADQAPLEYLQGHHNILSGLEKALAGLTPGESKQVLLSANEGYGPINPQAFVEIEKDQFPPNYDFKPGRELRVQDDQGKVHIASIYEIRGNTVRLDLNHPLAGKELLFKATILGLRNPTPEEMSRGRIGGCSSCSSGDCGSGECH